jgi:hypothetical protein
MTRLSAHLRLSVPFQSKLCKSRQRKRSPKRQLEGHIVLQQRPHINAAKIPLQPRIWHERNPARFEKLRYASASQIPGVGSKRQQRLIYEPEHRIPTTRSPKPAVSKRRRQRRRTPNLAFTIPSASLHCPAMHPTSCMY